jgi:DNA-directed RNA polymerase omega subunit
MVDISLEELLQRADNIYEAVAILFRRARQITDEQKLLIEMDMDTPPPSENRENEEFDDVEIDREALQREHKKYPKPTRVAMEEMLKGKIEHRYIDPDEDDNNSKQ